MMGETYYHNKWCNSWRGPQYPCDCNRPQFHASIPEPAVGYIIEARRKQLEAAEARVAERDGQIAAMREALRPLAEKRIPSRPTGNAGSYSFRFIEIEHARAALATTGREHAEVIRRAMERYHCHLDPAATCAAKDTVELNLDMACEDLVRIGQTGE